MLVAPCRRSRTAPRRKGHPPATSTSEASTSTDQPEAALCGRKHGHAYGCDRQHPGRTLALTAQ